MSSELATEALARKPTKTVRVPMPPPRCDQLLNLPNEALLGVAQCVEAIGIGELRRLGQTCRTLRQLVLPTLWGRIMFCGKWRKDELVIEENIEAQSESNELEEDPEEESEHDEVEDLDHDDGEWDGEWDTDDDDDSASDDEEDENLGEGDALKSLGYSTSEDSFRRRELCTQSNDFNCTDFDAEILDDLPAHKVFCSKTEALPVSPPHFSYVRTLAIIDFVFLEFMREGRKRSVAVFGTWLKQFVNVEKVIFLCHNACEEPWGGEQSAEQSAELLKEYTVWLKPFMTQFAGKDSNVVFEVHGNTGFFILQILQKHKLKHHLLRTSRMYMRDDIGQMDKSHQPDRFTPTDPLVQTLNYFSQLTAVAIRQSLCHNYLILDSFLAALPNLRRLKFTSLCLITDPKTDFSRLEVLALEDCNEPTRLIGGLQSALWRTGKNLKFLRYIAPDDGCFSERGSAPIPLDLPLPVERGGFPELRELDLDFTRSPETEEFEKALSQVLAEYVAQCRKLRVLRAGMLQKQMWESILEICNSPESGQRIAVFAERSEE